MQRWQSDNTGVVFIVTFSSAQTEHGNRTMMTTDRISIACVREVMKRFFKWELYLQVCIQMTLKYIWIEMCFVMRLIFLTDSVQPVQSNGFKSPSHHRILFQDFIEVVHRKWIQTTVCVGSNAGCPSAPCQQTNLCNKTPKIRLWSTPAFYLNLEKKIHLLSFINVADSNPNMKNVFLHSHRNAKR